jgi:hypothetical protein
MPKGENRMTNGYIVIVNSAEHSGFVCEVDYDNIWSSYNPDGWTYQEICGPHGAVWAKEDSKEEAQKTLDSFLECDAVERGEYCYTHNNPVS